MVVSVSSLNVQAGDWRPGYLLKYTAGQVFSCELCIIFEKNLRAAAYDVTNIERPVDLVCQKNSLL